MTDLSSDECWTEPANAIDVLETEIRDRRERDPCVNDWLNGVDDYLVVKLPLKVAVTILECAKRGMHTRRGRPEDSILRKSAKEDYAVFARVYKAELVDRGMRATGANSAEDRAADTFRKLLRRHLDIRLKFATFKRLMEGVPSELLADALQPGSVIRETVRGMMQRVPGMIRPVDK